MQRIDGTNVTMATPYDQVVANIRAAEQRDLMQIHDLPDWREGMPIALVGGGPSLHETIGELRQYRSIMVCGSAHDHVLASGIVPRWCVVCDPDPVMANYLQRSHPDTTYLVASQCDSAVFEALYWRKVALWHCGGASSDNAEIWGGRQTVVIGGGCTVLTRAIFIAISLGFHDIHLFGCDTCIQDGRHHAYEFSTGEENEALGQPVPFRLGGPDGREFLMAPYMLGQLFDFKRTLAMLGDRARFTSHGDGALTQLLRLGREAAQQLKAA